jgi:uncharacterized repeat protein (TIGR02543 family)
LPTPTRTGYSFKGWGTSSTATSGITGSYTPSKNITLYAIWAPNHINIYTNDTDKWKPYDIYIYHDNKWN